MSNECVSVIVPTRYETDHELNMMLSCTLEQLKKGDEIIVVDGSKGNRDGLKSKFGKGRINVAWPSDEDTGIAGARNVGFDAAANGILVYVDADCFPTHGYIDSLRTLASSSENLIQASFKTSEAIGTLGYQHELWRDVVRKEVAKANPALVVNGRGFAIQKLLAKRLGGKPFEVNKKVHGGEDLLFGHQLTQEGVGIELRPEIFAVNFGDPIGLRELCLQKFVHGRGDAVRGILPVDTFDVQNFERTVLTPIKAGVDAKLALSFWMHYLLGAYIGDRPIIELTKIDIQKLGIFDAMPDALKHKNLGINIVLPNSELTAHPY